MTPDYKTCKIIRKSVHPFGRYVWMKRVQTSSVIDRFNLLKKLLFILGLNMFLFFKFQ